MAFKRPVATRRGWVAEGSHTGPASAASKELAEELSPEPVEAAYQLSRCDDGGWRATLAVPDDVDSMADIVLDLGEREVHTSFKGGAPHILEFPQELHGVPANAWKVRFSRKKRELSLEISALDVKVVAELGGNVDLTAVTNATSSSPADHQCKEKPGDACAVDTWSKPKEAAPGTYDSWNTQNAPYGADGRVTEFDQKIDSLVSKVSQCTEKDATTLMAAFGKDMKSKKKPPNSGVMFDQNSGKPKQMEIDEEAVDAAGALMAHSMIAVKSSQKLMAIIDAGVSVDTTDEMGCTLLEKACLWGHVDIAKQLLDKGALAAGLGSAPSTPLHRAAAVNGNESQQLIQMLLKSGAKHSRKDSFGRTAADIAKASGNSVSHQILLAVQGNSLV